ncbi:DUF4065 domain-containing protein [Staphylococcus gallinarum]|uniref:Panacea domain-containing protein n=1 Tax=Staphylococcus TaxID=1279 RepID=UPI000E68D209|nr:type II toxin-antitoxin system antitoxin SocA domain-containing protein [Staphylococcus gallinarum]MCD8872687.1 DUF4065 domain-containing protein [Staphylococcus gallinarum]MCD8910190.1 DUF4065 domain-containing protein [Staphylococcus gallinarum]MCW0984586.1 DUF4065 domain-containing protein [Staphylococcus gallinarum]RIO80196.1 DUF4065 domain-containing protein [Staphylococcus gallinarum]
MINSKYNIEDIINWFLSKENMTPKKLQKLLYYAYAWDLVFENETKHELNTQLFNEDFEAWVHGPVIPTVWSKYREYGYHEIDKINDVSDLNLDPDTIDTLNQVWDVYGGYNGNQLESITHQENPWKKARENCLPLDRSNEKISKEVIFDYYVQRLN